MATTTTVCRQGGTPFALISAALAAFISVVTYPLGADDGHAPVGSHGHSEGGPAEFPNTPYPAIRAKYERNKQEIEKLTKLATDRAADEQPRVDALTKLWQKYQDPGIRAALGLANDRSEKVASLAVQILTAAVAMINHEMHPGQEMTAAETYVMKKHDLIKGVLRKSVSDPRKSVGGRATELLAAHGDREGLRQLAQASANGVYSGVEAANYFGLAGADVAGAYLAKYLDDKSPEAQTAAVTYLAGSAEYRDRIVNRYLYNPKAPLKARMAAAYALTAEPEKALPLLAVPQLTPPELYGEVLKHCGKNISQAGIEYLQMGVQEYGATRPAVDLRPITEQLDSLRESSNRF